MIISTEFGNFGSFHDLNIYMKLENKNTVHVFSADYWGINCIISSTGTTFNKQEVEKIVKGCDN